jgi:hypothetical protein
MQRIIAIGSVCSEPLGIRRALCKAIAPSANSRVVVYTDHSPVVDAVAAPIRTRTGDCNPSWRPFLHRLCCGTFPASRTQQMRSPVAL